MGFVDLILCILNSFSFFMQPAVNGKSSSDKIFGWGGAGGYVYQKEYFECFCSPEHAKALAAMVEKHPSLNLYAINIRGEEMQTGLELGGVTALTWGVFPNRCVHFQLHICAL